MRQAKIITPFILRRMLKHVAKSSFPERDRVIVLLSAKAGLRACEIARLDWSMVPRRKRPHRQFDHRPRCDCQEASGSPHSRILICGWR